ncbi:hypothetical protein BXT84_03165 [Sulfobacillus thermotolerans]|uniref:Copper amine oxidase-like N-terminal domain-containing protein n=1 Tax=Sulfobacillus thermotolerans TaxID=338644 RepID=A0ABM6RP05_9FIRM|nr:hypothetical protein BXT84_03165 [Sulfobacillus thermotolerans]
MLVKSRAALVSGVLLVSSASLIVPSTVADAATLPGPIYKLANAPTVYVDHNGSLHAVASPAMLYALGYQWSDLTTVKTLPAPVRSPITLLKLAASPQVYLYQNGQLHWIENGTVFRENGFQWANVYLVRKLPAPIGTPLTGITKGMGTVPPAASYSSLSAFPYIPAGGTKTIAIDALDANGSIDTTYNGDLTVSSSSSSVRFENSAGAIVLGPISVPFTNGVGKVTLKAAQVTGHVVLQWNTGSLPLTIMPNTTTQVGWRAFTASGTPISSLSPITTSTTVVLEPVDAAGAIVPGTLADNVALTLNSNAPGYQAYMEMSEWPGIPTLQTLYASAQGTSYSFSGSAFGEPLGVSNAYPATFSVAPDAPANLKVTAVTGPTSSAVPDLSAPVSNNIGQIQLVTGIRANETYQVQLQLETNNNQPILGIAQLFGSQAYPTTANATEVPTFSVSASGRSTPSTLTFGHVGTNHVYLTYHTGSANNVPDVLSLYGIQNEQLYGPDLGFVPIVQLVTNAF